MTRPVFGQTTAIQTEVLKVATKKKTLFTKKSGYWRGGSGFWVGSLEMAIPALPETNISRKWRGYYMSKTVLTW